MTEIIHDTGLLCTLMKCLQDLAGGCVISFDLSWCHACVWRRTMKWQLADPGEHGSWLTRKNMAAGWPGATWQLADPGQHGSWLTRKNMAAGWPGATRQLAYPGQHGSWLTRENMAAGWPGATWQLADSGQHGSWLTQGNMAAGLPWWMALMCVLLIVTEWLHIKNNVEKLVKTAVI